jgi:hypothetical protein
VTATSEGPMGLPSPSIVLYFKSKKAAAKYVEGLIQNFPSLWPSIMITKQEKSGDFYALTVTSISWDATGKLHSYWQLVST